MSILVKGIKIPKDEPLLVKINPNGTVSTTARNNYKKYNAVELPPHGDLIDYNFCLKNYELLHDDDGNPVYAVRMRDINAAPTIIEAEEVSE